jgi:hypothetical protein
MRRYSTCSPAHTPRHSTPRHSTAQQKVSTQHPYAAQPTRRSWEPQAVGLRWQHACQHFPGRHNRQCSTVPSTKLDSTSATSPAHTKFPKHYSQA